MFYGSTTVIPKSSTPPVLRDVYVRDVTCESAGTAIHIRGLPEQRISHVVLEHLHLNAVKGIQCRDVDNLTLRDVSGVIEEEPFLGCSNAQGLNITNVDLEQGSLKLGPIS
jgi:hypothetical protein